MAGQPGFFDVGERLKALSAAGDPLERLAAAVDFGLFRAELDAALRRSDRAKGGRPPYDPVLMFKVLVLQTLYTLSDEQTEYQLKDRLSFMRFVDLALHEPVPDATTVWLFRERLVRAGAIERLFARFDDALREEGLLAMGGQIVDATVVKARTARLTAEEKAAIRGGGTPEGWTPARKAQIDRDARWTLRRGRKRPRAADGGSRRRAVAIAVPVFGYKSHLGIDRVHGLIRTWTVTHAAAHDGGQLGSLLDPANTARGSGPTRPTARPPASSSWPAAATSATSSARSPGASRCRATSPAATPPGAGCGPRSSTCSRPRSAGSGWSSGPSGSPAPGPRSAWRTWPTTSPASPGSRPEVFCPPSAPGPPRPGGGGRLEAPIRMPCPGEPRPPLKTRPRSVPKAGSSRCPRAWWTA